MSFDLRVSLKIIFYNVNLHLIFYHLALFEFHSRRVKITHIGFAMACFNAL